MAATNGSSIVPFSVEGKSAIVTGAGSGINLEFASLLLARGCNVVFADLKLGSDAQKVVDAHRGEKGGPRAVFAETDVTDWGQLSRSFDTANEEFGDIDLVCPGAGVFEPSFSSFWHPPGVKGSPSKDPTTGLGHYATLDINVTHPIRMTQLAVSWFLNPLNGSKSSPQNPKRVVCIASIASEIAILAAPLYIASKWAVSGFVRSMEGLEQLHGIRVNAVAPGIVKTPLWTVPEQAHKLAFIDESKDEWVTTTEVAGAMLKLAEDPEMPGGTVLEIGHGSTRPIPLVGNPGPSGPGHTLSNAAASVEEVYGWIDTPGWGRIPH